MQKHTERRQLNNEGFSLIELLIAIVILSCHGHRRGCHGAVRGTYTGGDGRHL